MKRVLTAAIVAAFMLLTVGQSAAVGPDDGVWLVVQSSQQYGTFQFFASIHQNGATVVIMNAYQDGAWDYSIGTRSGATVQGTGYDPITGATYGTYSVTLTSCTTFSGQANVLGVVWSVSGTKLF